MINFNRFNIMSELNNCFNTSYPLSRLVNVPSHARKYGL